MSGIIKPDLNAYFYFTHVVEKRGFAPAGKALGIPKSRLSRHIQQLEGRLGTRLIQRTSRQFSVTDAGLEFYKHARLAVDEMEAAETAMIRRSEALSGNIRFTCSYGIAHYALPNIITSFLKANPKVEIDQFISNNMVDMIDTGIDFAIRGHMQPLPDSSLMQRKLVNLNWYLYASPEYLEKYGMPTHPDDLAGQSGLTLGWNSQTKYWTLKSSAEKMKMVSFIPQMRSDDMGTLKEASIQGIGIVSLPEYVCRADVQASRLMTILPEWTSGNATLSALFPSKKGIPPPVTSFLDHLSKQLPKVCGSQ